MFLICLTGGVSCLTLIKFSIKPRFKYWASNVQEITLFDCTAASPQNSFGKEPSETVDR